jgi:hypothetical protein
MSLAPISDAFAHERVGAVARPTSSRLTGISDPAWGGSSGSQGVCPRRRLVAVLAIAVIATGGALCPARALAVSVTASVTGAGTVTAGATCVGPLDSDPALPTTCALAAGGYHCSIAAGVCLLPVSAAAASGWAFSHWTGDCSGTSGCTLGFEAGADNAGAVGAVFIDIQAPNALVTGGPASGSVVIDPRATETFSLATNEDAEKPTLRCALDGGAWTVCTSRATVSGLTDGLHDFYVQATDKSSLTGDVAHVRWDQEVPATVAIVGGPSEGSAVSNRTASFALSSNKADSVFECQLEPTTSAPWHPCGSASLTGLGQGPHVLVVRALFHAPGEPADSGYGHPSAPVARHWSVDTISPATLLGEDGPADGELTSLTTAKFTFTASEPAHFDCSLDGAPFAACDSPLRLTNLRAGRHTFRVRAIDPAGNTDASAATRSWSVLADNHRRGRFPYIGVGVTANSTAAPSGVRITSLLLSPVPSHTTIRVTCQGTGCPKRATLHIRHARRRVSLTGVFAGRTLHRGALIDLRATKPGTIGRTARITVKRHSIHIALLCLPPGKHIATRCS